MLYPVLCEATDQNSLTGSANWRLKFQISLKSINWFLQVKPKAVTKSTLTINRTKIALLMVMFGSLEKALKCYTMNSFLGLLPKQSLCRYLWPQFIFSNLKKEIKRRYYQLGIVQQTTSKRVCKFRQTFKQFRLTACSPNKFGAPLRSEWIQMLIAFYVYIYAQHP